MVDLPAAPEPVGTVRWSPDGRYLCAVTFADPRRLWLFDVRTREWRRQSATHVEYPTWTRDSRYIHYDTEGSAAGELRRFRVADGVDEKIVDVYEIPVERAWGWSGVAPDGSPLILRFPAPQLYQIDLFNRVAR